MNFLLIKEFWWNVLVSIKTKNKQTNKKLSSTVFNIYNKKFMFLEHQISNTGQFFETEIYTSSESWINKLSIDVWFVRIGQYLAEMQKNLNIEKIAFKVFQMKILAMHITNQKLSFDIFTVGNLQNISMEHDLYLIS